MGPFLLPQLTHLVTGKSVKDPEFLAEREEFLRTLGKRLPPDPAHASAASWASAAPSSSDPGVGPPTCLRNDRNV